MDNSSFHVYSSQVHYLDTTPLIRPAPKRVEKVLAKYDFEGNVSVSGTSSLFSQEKYSEITVQDMWEMYVGRWFRITGVLPLHKVKKVGGKGKDSIRREKKNISFFPLFVFGKVVVLLPSRVIFGRGKFVSSSWWLMFSFPSIQSEGKGGLFC